jgi:hypothetical protein
LFGHGIALFLCFCRRDVADGFEQPPVIEPVDPFQRRVFDRFEIVPRPTPVDHVDLLNPIYRLGLRVVTAAADTADRWLDARFGEAFGVLDGDILAAAIGVVDEAAAVRRSAIVKGLLQRIKDEAGMVLRLARQPTIRRAIVWMTHAT